MGKAKLDVGFDDLLKMLDKLEAPEEIAKKAVGKAEKALLKSTKAAVKNSLINKGSSGLVNSFTPTGAKENQWGVYSVVRPVGSDSDGIEYSQKALWLEYGRYRVGNAGRKANSIEENQVQRARPWRQAAVNNAEAEVIRIIEDTISQEVDK